MNDQPALFGDAPRPAHQMTAAAAAFGDRVETLSEPRFGGETYEPEQDSVRLTGQVLAVFELTQSGGWWTLAALAARTGGSEAAVSARLRDLRKRKFGGYDVERRRVAGGLFEYRVKPRRDGAEGREV